MKTLLFLFTFLIFFTSCSSKKDSHIGYDSDLEKPDIDQAGMMHGTNLTPLGCIVYAPWALNKSSNLYVSIKYNNTELKSYIIPDTDIMFQLKFKFYKNGDLLFWLNPANSKTISTTPNSNQKTGFRKEYTSGHWNANFQDSILRIDFGTNDLNLQKIEAKITGLTSSSMYLSQTSHFDTLLHGKIQTCEKTTYISLEH